jgi:hypothetical protein
MAYLGPADIAAASLGGGQSAVLIPVQTIEMPAANEEHLT